MLMSRNTASADSRCGTAAAALLQAATSARKGTLAMYISNCRRASGSSSMAITRIMTGAFRVVEE